MADSLCPNPLFEQWLEEWRAKAIRQNSSFNENYLTKALVTLRKYPLPLASGKDCAILKSFGKKLCLKIDRKLEKRKKKYFKEQENLTNGFHSASDSDIEIVHNDFEKKEKKELEIFDGLYIPEKGSEAYIILITLYKNSLDCWSEDYMTKNEIIAHIQKDYDRRLEIVTSESDSYWEGMANLIKNNLVIRRSNPEKYNLTDSGFSLASNLNDFEQKNVVNYKKSDSEVLDKNKDQKSDLSHIEIVTINDDEKNDCLLPTPKSMYMSQTWKKTKQPVEIFLVDDDEKINTLESEFENEDDKVISDCVNNNHEEKNIPSNSSEQSFNAEKHSDCSSSIKKNKSSSRVDESILFKNTNSKNKNLIKNVFFKQNANQTFRIPPKNFDIILLVNPQELPGAKTKREIISEIQKLGISFQARSLSFGEFAWIAKCRFTKKELMLPHIIEIRKISDSDSSLQDSKTEKQKLLLKKLGFKIKQFTHDHKDSILCLSTMTKMLIKMFEKKELVKNDHNNLKENNPSEDVAYLIEFTEFNEDILK